MGNDLLDETFTRRTLILSGLKGALFLGLAGRLYDLQVLKKSHYEKLSDKNRLFKYLISPERGLILDCNNATLADTKVEHFAIYEPSENSSKLKDMMDDLKKIIDFSERDLAHIEKKLSSKKSADAIILKENITLKEMYQLEAHLPDFLGVRCEKVKSRFYPDPYAFSHLLGFVGMPSEQEKTDDTLFKIPEYRVGKAGLEKKFNTQLSGSAGFREVEVNAYRKVLRLINEQPSIQGDALKLTIDERLQKKVYEILSPHKSAACVIMEADSGAIRSFVSYPGYDTNLFLQRIPKKIWDDLSLDECHPLINKLTHGLYSPGSTFKMVVALAALKKGIIKEQQSYSCNGFFEYKNHTFHCWKWKTNGHGALNLAQAIASSCDVYFYNLALKLSVDDIAEVAHSFGLGEITGIDMPHEKSGLVPSSKWHEDRYKKKWLTGDSINLSIGQGKILATPLQLCRMTAALINGGKLVHPYLVEKNQKKPIPINVDHAHLQTIIDGMDAVVNEPYGTAYNARIIKADYEMGGKTGSTQVARITQQQRDDGTHNDRPWHLKEHALFVGYAPTKAPKYVATVLVEHGGSGGKIAAPIGRDVLLAAQELL